jgi:hypothetical protein
MVKPVFVMVKPVFVMVKPVFVMMEPASIKIELSFAYITTLVPELYLLICFVQIKLDLDECQSGHGCNGNCG